jgi:hypothetical protein
LLLCYCLLLPLLLLLLQSLLLLLLLLLLLMLLQLVGLGLKHRCLLRHCFLVQLRVLVVDRFQLCLGLQ